MRTISSAPVRPAIFTAFMDVHRAMHDTRWKLIVYPQINRLQLFDLVSDPDEVREVSTSWPAEGKPPAF